VDDIFIYLSVAERTRFYDDQKYDLFDFPDIVYDIRNIFESWIPSMLSLIFRFSKYRLFFESLEVKLQHSHQYYSISFSVFES